MKFSKLWVLLLAASFTIMSCGDDDSPEEMVVTTDDDGGMTDDGDNGMSELLAAQEMTTANLTNDGSGKVWRIEQATLNNESGAIDISSNFNVVDDEFIFSGSRTNGSLEWRQGNAIGVDGTSSQETLLDFYKAPVMSSFSFDAESSTNLSGLDGNMTFQVIDENTITGQLSFTEGRRAGETLDFDLTTKTSEDYAAPQTDLQFSNFAVLFNDCVSSCAPGFAGSYADNSLFVSTRAAVNNNNSELVVKYNAETGTEESFLFPQADFVSKQLLVRDDQLVIVGGQYVNRYDLDDLNNPTSELHGKALTRFGTAVQGDILYIIGGGLDNVDPEKIFQYNLETGQLSDFVSLPEPRFGARGTIVNNKLYVFGGTTTFGGSDAMNTLYIIDIATQQITTETMPVSLNYSYVERFQNLIYVAGRIDLRNDEGNNTGRDEFIGVYDTRDGSWTELTTNLTGTQDDFVSIHGMGLFNNRLYIIYDDGLDDDNNPDTPSPNNILVADLN
ncbi:hypothetical protein EAX61_02550 [Dokdonia sinensis]|uniref:Galactose oxidase n=1 Tax=Dokdonia sinensis TaxID=2479847 RepID=A0A3M0GEX8_9FLAO|nr:hypothetical protein [Dokdonia sinensis]RMB63290.1 hypothetical protein EAX61_02550 [Dokdonia sinensis]